MGLLDDAIRQHLELKRRHGADPSDVAKLEQEAFGPIEREEALEVPGARVSDAAHETAREEKLAYEDAEHEADDEWANAHPETPADVGPSAPLDPDPDPEPEVEVEPEVASAPEAAPDALRAGGSVRLDDVGERTVESVDADREPGARPAGEPEAEGDPQPDPGPEAHDELEETPEFLEETPEHDRLWFEQKPPRDFDF